jgi:urea transport system permease protein
MAAACGKSQVATALFDVQGSLLECGPRRGLTMAWFSQFGAIVAMQGFNGLSVFSVLLLMALGLAIIFGQMGVINMAHGEFLTIGAYTTYVLSVLTHKYAPALQPVYFFVAILVAFAVAFAFGYLVEWLLIRHLYRRPLDTLLATWGLSLAMQQTFRSVFGSEEVSPDLPQWLMGSLTPYQGLDIPINGLMVMVVTIVLTAVLLLFLYKSQWGVKVRATTQNRVMAGAVGINTGKVDRLTFALGCGIAGIAGAAFTTIGSTGPTSGSLYIVDTFLTVVFGGAQSLFGTIASAFSIAQTQSTTEFFLSGSMAKVLTLSAVIVILMLRPQGLFATKVRR